MAEKHTVYEFVIYLKIMFLNIAISKLLKLIQT